MTQDEATIIANIVRYADGGAPVSVRSLCNLLTESPLGFTFTCGEEILISEPDSFCEYYVPNVTAAPK